jgi:hypothetical protein
MLNFLVLEKKRSMRGERKNLKKAKANSNQDQKRNPREWSSMKKPSLLLYDL